MGGFGVHEYFEDGDSEYVAVDHGHLVDGPVWGVCRYYGIDFGAVGKYSVDEFLGKFGCGLWEWGLAEACLEGVVGLVVGAVDFVEDLYCGDAGFAAQDGFGWGLEGGGVWGGHGVGGDGGVSCCG